MNYAILVSTYLNKEAPATRLGGHSGASHTVLF
jgi:hypothetical protein